jgi:hypothetical protein
LRQPLLPTLVLDLGYIAGRLNPFFAKAASGAQIPRDLNSMKDGPAHSDVVVGAKAKLPMTEIILSSACRHFKPPAEG